MVFFGNLAELPGTKYENSGLARYQGDRKVSGGNFCGCMQEFNLKIGKTGSKVCFCNNTFALFNCYYDLANAIDYQISACAASCWDNFCVCDSISQLIQLIDHLFVVDSRPQKWIEMLFTVFTFDSNRVNSLIQ